MDSKQDSKQPLVSVLLNSFNSQRFISEQIDSILAQTYANLELIVCDDCSTDRTPEIVREYMQKDSRVKLTLNERNLGASSTFQKNCHLCRGEFIAPSDHDDFWLPEKIGLMVAYFSEHPETELVFTDSVITNMDFSKKMGSLQNKFGNSSQGEPVSINALLERNLVPFHASMFRQTLTRKIVPIPEGLMHDIWTALVCSLKSPLGYINQGLDLYRQHEKNMVGVSTRSTVFYSKRLNDLGFLQ